MIVEFLVGLVGLAVAQMKLNAVMGHVRHRERVGCERDAGRIAAVRRAGLALLLGRDIRHENALQARGGAGIDVADVENGVGKLLFKHPRLDVGGELVRAELIFDAVELADGPRF